MADGEIKDLGAQLDGLDLPIMEVVDDMRAQVAASPLTIIAAPPGAGKTTVVPLLLAGERWAGPAGRIIVLEPRRLAARAAAQRMAELAGGRVGDLVGLRARLETRVGARTRIEVVTEGVFTRMILDDPGARRRCGGGVRRISRTLGGGGPGARAGARQPVGVARGPEDRADVGDTGPGGAAAGAGRSSRGRLARAPCTRWRRCIWAARGRAATSRWRRLRPRCRRWGGTKGRSSSSCPARGRYAAP